MVNENITRQILDRLEEIEKKLESLSTFGKDKLLFDKFISEHDAKELLKRGSTWFYDLRRYGFPYTKVGGQVYYEVKDLEAYLRQNKKGKNGDIGF